MKSLEEVDVMIRSGLALEESDARLTILIFL